MDMKSRGVSGRERKRRDPTRRGKERMIKRRGAARRGQEITSGEQR